MKKVILVGRHAGEIPGVVVVEQVNQVWALDVDEAFRQLIFLRERALDAGASLLFQNVPGILAAALCRYVRKLFVASLPPVHMGVIISKPGPRLAGVSRTCQFDLNNDNWEEIQALIMHANGRAKVEWDHSVWPAKCVVTVDPVAAFEFDHIEWF